ncbi:uncharacterized protein G2W53_028574 [Senna tora]|uniref:Uncharacterized protein n=1 Tax=Senna tora TaxID=362788 RepID=A0A834T4I8_9FABA|nr:uncharacterized protein G2W53_028574 [Senna tora]
MDQDKLEKEREGYQGKERMRSENY